MDKLTEIEVFLRIADEGSLAGAARKLRRSPSSVSKILMLLEGRLGVPLILRNTRNLTLTDAGIEFNARWREIMAEIEEAERQASQVHAEASGHLRVVGVNMMTQPLFIKTVEAFLGEHPAVTIELVEVETMPSLSAVGGADVGLRIGQLSHKGLLSEPLAEAYRVIAASPEYLARYGQPVIPEDIAGHRCLTFSINALLNVWEIRRAGEFVRIQPEGSLSASHGYVIRQAALEGVGIAQLPDTLIGPDLREGRLVALFPEQLAQPISQLCAIYPLRQRTPRKVRVFVDFLHEAFTPRPPWQEGLELGGRGLSPQDITDWHRRRRRWLG